MNMEPYDAYRYYMSVKMHFESETYDCQKYNYKTFATQQSFWKRRDKYQFAKIAKKFNEPLEMINFYVSQFINQKTWVGDMLTEEDQWTKWQKRNQALSYTFEQDINKLSLRAEAFDDIFKARHSPYPDVIYYYMKDEVCIETVVILDKLTGFIKRAQVSDTIVWPEVSLRVRKYSTFVNPDLKKMKEIVLRVFTS